MKYEIVNLEEKILVGIGASTSNNSPKMGEVIGGLWEKFYQGGIAQTIKNKVNSYAIGLYSDYSGDDYTVTVGNEVSGAENEGLSVKVIPAGKYAKFSAHGNMVTAVAQAWSEIWSMNLNRSYTGDFEEYLNCDMNNADVDIYIALK
ncbi:MULTISPECIES: GyrI-like domain-containing protein [unclassified Sedimentibacter]|uniref:GyrI-like domain-containing protein n=1 Tax=unclassified Sedimentibacter TaxID=2649220 RepID=UPI0027E1047B|nr:GyrI-like domain-containing protein [Sedimentibacter sp. MB35-C1]WMJ75937.1 GyrI-like domain-containing protein [Sedimentibacter sp. MB35-C1]